MFDNNGTVPICKIKSQQGNIGGYRQLRIQDIQKDVVNPTSYWYCRQRDSQKYTAKAKTIVIDDQVFLKF